MLIKKDQKWELSMKDVKSKKTKTMDPKGLPPYSYFTLINRCFFPLLISYTTALTALQFFL